MPDDRIRSTRRFCDGLPLWRPGLAAPPGGVHGQGHLGAGKAPAGPPAQNASGGTAGRGHCGLLPAGGHLSADEPCLPGSCPHQPVAGAGRPDVLVRAGTGRKGAGAGEHQCLPGTGQARPACRPQGGQPHRGAGHPGSDAGGGDQSRCGDGGRKRQRRRDRTPALYAHRRGTAGPDLQGHQHDGQYAGLQKRKIPLLWPHPSQDGRCGKLPSQPPCRPAVGGCRSLYPQ